MSEESNAFTAVIAGASAVAGAAIAALAAVVTQKPGNVAKQQEVLNASFSQFMTQASKEIADLESRLAADEQYINSLVEILRRHDIDVPRRPTSEVVFLQPTRIRGAG